MGVRFRRQVTGRPEERIDDRMRMTAQELNRSTLARQLLLRREALDAAEGVRRVVALQAQQAGLAVCRTVEPARRIRPGRARRGVRGPPCGQGDHDAAHPPRRARGRPPGLPGGHASGGACLPAGRPLHRVRADGEGRGRAGPPAAGVRGPAADHRRVRGLAGRTAGLAAEGRGVVGAAAVRAAAPRAHRVAVVVRPPALVHRTADRCAAHGSGGVRRVAADAGPALPLGVRARLGHGRGAVRHGHAGQGAGCSGRPHAAVWNAWPVRRARSCSTCRALRGRTGRNRRRPG